MSHVYITFQESAKVILSVSPLGGAMEHQRFFSSSSNILPNWGLKMHKENNDRKEEEEETLEVTIRTVSVPELL